MTRIETPSGVVLTTYRGARIHQERKWQPWTYRGVHYEEGYSTRTTREAMRMADKPLTRWQRLEEYLFDHDKADSEFTAEEYAKAAGYEDNSDASLDIQSYLRAQRAGKKDKGTGAWISTARTLYLLRRVAGTRTASAKWSVGVRTKDARMIGKAFASDTKMRVERAFQPDLVTLRKLNPRAARQVEQQISTVIDGAMSILTAAAEGMLPPEDEE